ncbi:MAG: DUF697 domain-containing protein [Sedimentisphaerales bacterium]|nr:DUF697 domain-containing protein [Sedimentisphaerales bacterium]MBN2841998.1 DUF697 domain-containing protein [Sedimentisphaerales bacterium]
MDHNKDKANRPIGDPLHKSPAVKATELSDASDNTATAANSDNNTTHYRTGDQGVGIPNFKPQQTRILNADEQQEIREQQEQQLREEFTRKLHDLENSSGRWNLPPALRKTLTWGILTLASVLSLILISQIVSFANDIKALPWPYNILAASLAGIFALILTLVIIKLIWQIVRLQRSPAINIKAISTLQQRQRFQKQLQEHSSQAQEQLQNFLREYPLHNDGRKRLISIGLSGQQADDLITARDYLLTKDSPCEAEHWLEDFDRRFQSILDQLAHSRVRQYALRAGAGTALSPISAIDQMIVIYSSTAMIKDLLFIYQLRPAFGQTAVILTQALLNTYLSGMIEETTRSAADSIGDSVSQWTGNLGGILGGSLIKSIGARTAEAALNALLISRLGNKAISQLQPCRK